MSTSLSQFQLRTLLHTLEHGSPEERRDLARVLAASLDVSSPARLYTGGVHDPLAFALLPLLRKAKTVDVLAAFVMPSGVSLMRQAFQDALTKGTTLRVLSGDYLCRTHPRALGELLDLMDEIRAIHTSSTASLEVRMIEMDRLPGLIPSFHPKAWRIELCSGEEVAFVGSSNLSRAALLHGVEWNVRFTAQEDPHGMQEIRQAFDTLWHQASTVTRPWLADYALRHAEQDTRPTTPHPLDDDSVQTFSPRPHQQKALDALAQHRAQQTSHTTHALLVMATGTGKTWTAMFDLAQLEDELGHIPKVLWIAHRDELLKQAAHTYRSCFPTHTITYASHDGIHASSTGGLLVTSIQRLSRQTTLDTLPPDTFNIIVIDEVHHALSPTYQRVLTHFNASYVLGLTATPQRGDGRHMEEFFGAPVYRMTLGAAIASDALVPFHYHGLLDPVDYEALPWRAQSFDPEALDHAVMVEERQALIWDAWQTYEGTRTLVFCCSIAHADFLGQWLAQQGARVAVLHSGPHSDDRTLAVEQLRAGELDAICVVGLFNEGVDVPCVDRIIMARPTASSVIFLQQLGRGLRLYDGKTQLVVLDLVGNHHTFLNRFREILSTFSSTMTLREALASRHIKDTVTGCQVTLELGTIALMNHFLVESVDEGFVHAYNTLREHMKPARPRLVHMLDRGRSFERLRHTFGSWFHVLAEMDDLNVQETHVLELTSSWFEALERTRLSIKELFEMEDALLVEDLKLDHLPDVFQKLGSSPFAHHLIAGEEFDPGLVDTWRAMTLEILEYLSVRRTQLDHATSSQSLRATATWSRAQGAVVHLKNTNKHVDFYGDRSYAVGKCNPRKGCVK